MTQRVIVGLDGSAASAAAFSWAAEEARLRHIDLVAWTIDEPSHGEPDAALTADEATRAELRRLVAGVPLEFRHGHGDAAKELISACTPGDLLVLGPHGRGRLPGLLLGSVGRSCLSHAPCPVVIVRPRPEGAGPTGRVMVGIDMSGHSRAALRVAAQEARLRGAELQMVHAVHWDNVGAEFLTPTEEQLLDWGHRLEAAELAATDVSARHVVLPGQPSEVLVEQSAHTDLLVLGSRGRNPLAGLLLGSVSEHCVRHAACPVMVVRPTDEAKVAR